MFKKFLAVLLALAMALTLSLAVLAEGEEGEGEEEEEPFEWHAGDKYGPYGFSKSDRELGEDDGMHVMKVLKALHDKANLAKSLVDDYRAGMNPFN